jgi:hypothetical protein
MNKPGTNRFVRLVCPILAAMSLFFSTGAGRTPTPSKYTVTIGADEYRVCVGQTVNIVVSYSLNEGQTETAKPSIYVFASHGKVTPETTTGARDTSYVGVRYTAENSGLDTVTAFINGGFDGSAKMVIKVLGDCQYSYKLVILLKTSSKAGDLSYIWQDYYKSEETFAVVGTGMDLSAEQTIQSLKAFFATLYIEDLKWPSIMPDCNVAATVWTGLEGDGTLIVKGGMVKSSRQDLVRVEFSTAGMDQSPTFKVPCKQETKTVTVPLSFSVSPFIQEDFPLSGGARNIKIDFFEKGIEKLQNGNTIASYKAYLKIWRVK